MTLYEGIATFGAALTCVGILIALFNIGCMLRDSRAYTCEKTHKRSLAAVALVIAGGMLVIHSAAVEGML